MSDNLDTTNIEVPEGFPPLSQPTKAEDKVPKDKIKIEYIKPEDLEEFASISYATFPDVFWKTIETPDRPSLDERIVRLAKHFKPWLSQPGVHMLKAVHTDTREIMAIATWHHSGHHPVYPTAYPMIPGYAFPSTYIPCTWRNDLVGPLDFAEKQHWSIDEVKEMYAHHRDAWTDLFSGYELGRIKEMGDKPHWYLAPLCVREKYWAKGVGKVLLMWGLERADEAGEPCVLESMPNARPVYYHFGFVPTAEHGQGKDSQLVRLPRGRGPRGW